MDGEMYGQFQILKVNTMGVLTEEIKQKGLEVLRSHNDGKLLTHLNACVHCGLCANSCVYYKIDTNEHYVPAKKVETSSHLFSVDITLF